MNVQTAFNKSIEPPTDTSTYHEKIDHKAIHPPRDKEKLLTEYKAVDIRELLAYTFPEREHILYPVFTLSSINMIFAWRGIGKTHFALGIAWAAASGGGFLKWQASRSFKVLYL
ncbi:MAG: AAA family ATPase, partial [Candidatus Methylumidiphilus sp.]